ncbi:MAG: class I SAM-dependent methyltransferase [bacterium]
MADKNDFSKDAVSQQRNGGYRARKVYQNKRVVQTYDKDRFTNFKGKIVNKMELKLIGRALNLANIKPPNRLLDVPCGTGRLSIYLASKGYKVVGVDLSNEMVMCTREKLKSLNLEENIVVEEKDAEKLTYPENSFDACVSLRLFGHTPENNRKKIILELKRVSRSVLILAYYHKNCIKNLIRRKQRRAEWHPVTYHQIDKELKQCGLSRIKFLPLLPGISETIVVIAKK